MNEDRKPLVSILCITYNHERYIGDAIEGFLKQETDFSFEIIVQDDASIDKTADIIREYEKKYPKIIKPIYNKENQYSKCPSSIILPLLKASKGKYIAFCEGDDYWTDPLKLQKQIKEMKKHPECLLSFHPAIEKYEDGGNKNKILCSHSKKNKIFTIEEVISNGGGFIPSASLVINAEVLPRIISFFETNAKEVSVGDIYIQILGSENGGALYLSDVMSVYRICSDSWTDTTNNTLNQFSSEPIYTLTGFNEIDAFTNYKYTELFANIKRRNISEIIITVNMNLPMKKIIYNHYKNELSVKDKILWNTIFKYQIIVKIIKTVQKLAISLTHFPVVPQDKTDNPSQKI